MTIQKFTDEQRRRVTILAGAGITHEEIATGLGISTPSLYKYLTHELTVGASERRAEVIEAMYKAASRGNVAAARLYVQLVPPTVTTELQPVLIEGKKAQRNAAAKVAQEGTKWQELLPPSVQ